MPHEHTQDEIESGQEVTEVDAVGEPDTANGGDTGDDEENDDHRLPPLVLMCDLCSSVLFSWVMTLVVAGGAGYISYQFGRGASDWSRDWPILILMRFVFPAVGGLAILGSLWLTLRWLRQGATKLTVHGEALSMGGQLRASVSTRKKLEPIGSAVARLECKAERRYSTGSGKSRVETTEVWHEERPIEPARAVISARRRIDPGDGTRFEVDFPIPRDSVIRETKAAAKALSKGGTTRFKWVLWIKVPTRGMDHEAKFDLPVS